MSVITPRSDSTEPFKRSMSKPDNPKYQRLVQKLCADIPMLLPCMDLQGEPLPLTVVPDVPYAPMTSVHGADLSGVRAGEEIHFLLIAHDAHGNLCGNQPLGQVHLNFLENLTR